MNVPRSVLEVHEGLRPEFGGQQGLEVQQQLWMAGHALHSDQKRAGLPSSTADRSSSVIQWGRRRDGKRGTGQTDRGRLNRDLHNRDNVQGEDEQQDFLHGNSVGLKTARSLSETERMC